MRDEQKALMTLTTKTLHLPKVILMALVLWCATNSSAQQQEIIVRLEPDCEGVRGFFTGPQGAVSTIWTFSDGATTTDPDPVHRFAFGEPIGATVVATDGNGEQQTFSSVYPAVEQPDLTRLEMPTVFTPNGDGINDTFGPSDLTDPGPCADLAIWNRYGQRVFASQGNDITWDGRTFAGEPVVSGAYFYVFKVGGLEWTGHLTLIR
jgi:gliding motility-associated-like protein